MLRNGKITNDILKKQFLSKLVFLFYNSKLINVKGKI